MLTLRSSGRKHPWALGQPVSECWSEIWHILQPLIDTPFKGGPATWIEDLELHIQRLGFTEEAHFTVAYSPVPDSTAPTRSAACWPRCMRSPRKSSASAGSSSCAISARRRPRTAPRRRAASPRRRLRRHGKDVPFALLYLVDPDGAHARLAGAAGIERAPRQARWWRRSIRRRTTSGGWPLAAAFHGQTMVTVTNLGARFGAVPAGPWADPLHSAVVVPVRSSKADELAGLLVAGVSSRLTFDELYRGFYELAREPDRDRHRQRAGLRGGAQAGRGAGRDRSRQDRLLLATSAMSSARRSR